MNGPIPRGVLLPRSEQILYRMPSCKIYFKMHRVILTTVTRYVFDGIYINAGLETNGTKCTVSDDRIA